MKIALNTFQLNSQTLRFHSEIRSHRLQHNKQYHMNVLRYSLYLNDHRLKVFLTGSKARIQKL